SLWGCSWGGVWCPGGVGGRPDEPTGNLDPDTTGDIMLLLERINRTGTTVLMATHDHHIVDSMRRRVVELDLGRVVRDEARGVYGVGR
ncbi:hypothetical protein ACFWPB_19145, partial [Rhodococcus sp. NPDC058514]